MRLPAAVGLWLLPVFSAAAAAQEAPAPRPRLVVLCAVDQLAAWVFAEALPHLPEDGGFRRLLRDGVHFTHCAYQHACTETGPGHATIGTGVPAAVHGIVRNVWWVPSEKATVYCVGHPQAALPGLTEGKDRGPDRLLAPTLAELVKREIPGSRVASVSWKDRAAILMVGKRADVAAWIEASTGNLVTNTAWATEVPAWIADWNRARAIDSFYGQEWARCGPDSAYEGLVDDRPYEIAHLNGSNARTLPQPVTGGKPEPSLAYYNQLYYSPFGNTVVRLLAEACIEGMQLGADDVPDLLCVSFSSTDTVGHAFGPESVEERDTLLRLDRELAAFLAFLDARIGRERYTLFLTSDHGVAPTPEWAKQRGLSAGRALLHTLARAAAEKAIAARFGAPPTGKRYCVHAGEYALVFDREAIAANRGDLAAEPALAAACADAAAAVAGVKGIRAAYVTASVLRDPPGEDPFRVALRAALHPDRAGDVQFVSEPYWLDGATPASHGTPHAYDREVPGFAFGDGVARGLAVGEPVTPGLGVVLLAARLHIGAPAGVVDRVPEGVLPAK